MTFQFLEKDITTVEVDVIVNAANEQLQEGGGVCGAIFRAAGPKELQAACDQIGHCAVGEAVMTDGFSLPAKKIIHTVGPVWQGGRAKEEKQLSSCYRNALQLAEAHGYRSIAFPLISSGIFGYPWGEALRVAVKAILDFLQTSEMKVYLLLLEKEKIKQAHPYSYDLAEFLRASFEEREAIRGEMTSMQSSSSYVRESQDLAQIFDALDCSFSEKLLAFIDQKGMDDVETYKKANVDRRLFSKIKNDPDYTPSKKTAIAFAIALQLSLAETQSLLEKAGYTLSKSHKFDLIIRYFIEKSVFDIFTINEALFAFDEDLLGV